MTDSKNTHYNSLTITEKNEAVIRHIKKLEAMESRHSSIRNRLMDEYTRAVDQLEEDYGRHLRDDVIFYKDNQSLISDED